MAIKTDELRRDVTVKGTDTLLLASSDMGTAQLALAQAAAFSGPSWSNRLTP